MGYYNDLTLGDADGELWSDEGWSIDDRRPGHDDAAPALSASDLTIPPVADILVLVTERHALALHHEDFPGARQLDRVRANLGNGAVLSWSFGDLLIQSVNNPGNVYSVSRAGCTCPNGASGRASCWHVALFDLLLDLQDVAADNADADAEGSEEEESPPPPPVPITVSTAPGGLAFSRRGVTHLVTTPDDVGPALAQLISGAADARAMGLRIARARAAQLAA